MSTATLDLTRAAPESPSSRTRMTPRWRTSGVLVLWSFAAMAWLTRGVQATETTGFGIDLAYTRRAVVDFLSGDAPYAVEFYPYPPTYLLLSTPLGMASRPVVSLVYLCLAMVAIPAALGLVLRGFGCGLRGLAFPFAVLALSLYRPALDTLMFLNINAVVVVLLAVWLLLEQSGRHRRSAAVLGLTLAMKPVLIALVLIYLLRRQWRLAAVLTSAPLLLGALILPLLQDPLLIVTKALPGLLGGWDGEFAAANISLAGVGHLWGVDEAVVLVLRVLVVIVAVVIARKSAASPVESSGALLIASFLGSSFALVEYAVLLVPVVVALFARRSLLGATGIVCLCVPIGAPVGATYVIPVTTYAACVGLTLMLAALWWNTRSPDGRVVTPTVEVQDRSDGREDLSAGYRGWAWVPPNGRVVVDVLGCREGVRAGDAGRVLFR
jgi:hypothetical protein